MGDAILKNVWAVHPEKRVVEKERVSDSEEGPILKMLRGLLQALGYVVPSVWKGRPKRYGARFKRWEWP